MTSAITSMTRTCARTSLTRIQQAVRGGLPELVRHVGDELPIERHREPLVCHIDVLALRGVNDVVALVTKEHAIIVMRRVHAGVGSARSPCYPDAPDLRPCGRVCGKGKPKKYSYLGGTAINFPSPASRGEHVLHNYGSGPPDRQLSKSPLPSASTEFRSHA
jgi:hypothetical protein